MCCLLHVLTERVMPSTYTVPSNYPDMSARLLPGGYENKENLAEHEANWQIRS